MSSPSNTDLSYLPDSVSDSVSDTVSELSDTQLEPGRRHAQYNDVEKLANAIDRIVKKPLDTTEHGPVMLHRKGREEAVAREKYEHHLQDAITAERRELLDKGHEKAPVSTADPSELRFVRTAFAGVRQFIEAITGYAEEVKARRAHERETIERLQKQQEALRGTERMRWRTLPDENLLDEFIRTTE